MPCVIIVRVTGPIRFLILFAFVLTACVPAPASAGEPGAAAGAGTGMAALINGTVDLANASRAIKPEEVDRAQANAITPVEHVVARRDRGDRPSREPGLARTLQQISDIPRAG